MKTYLGAREKEYLEDELVCLNDNGTIIITSRKITTRMIGTDKLFYVIKIKDGNFFWSVMSKFNNDVKETSLLEICKNNETIWHHRFLAFINKEIKCAEDPKDLMFCLEGYRYLLNMLKYYINEYEKETQTMINLNKDVNNKNELIVFKSNDDVVIITTKGNLDKPEGEAVVMTDDEFRIVKIDVKYFIKEYDLTKVLLEEAFTEAVLDKNKYTNFYFRLLDSTKDLIRCYDKISEQLDILNEELNILKIIEEYVESNKPIMDIINKCK